MHLRPARVIGVVAATLLLAGCPSTPAPDPTATPTPSSPPSTSTSTAPEPSATALGSTAPNPTASRLPVPGEPCDPADGSPDCTDATADGQLRYLEGYADCVTQLPGEEYGLCTDLDGDGRAGYPDSG